MLVCRYYMVMSLTKQIILGVLATVSLVLFGVGSYYASTTLFPDPQDIPSGNVTPTPSGEANSPTIGDMRKLEPQSVATTKDEAGNIVLTFTTAEEVGVALYLTPVRADRVSQAMKDRVNGVPVAGSWFTVTSEESKATTHSFTIPKESVGEATEVYYYLILSYKRHWLPYGQTTDYSTGVAEPYTIKL